MARWEARVERVLQNPPGSNKGLSAESIERSSIASFSKQSSWSIICEEVLDTQFPTTYFERARQELLARGITDTEIEEMRRLAWLTAGWLNFECGVWDWCGMDEKDIIQAIETQYSERYISAEERDHRVEFVRKYDTPRF